jgi:hypothetical protein
MDGDAIPFCPMDYLFNLSEPLEGKPLLKENLLLAWRAEPAMGSFFMLQPKKGDHKLIQDIIAKREEEGMNSKELFNNVTGWGHVIKPPDRWKSLTATEGRNATLWSWHGDFVDQGTSELPERESRLDPHCLQKLAFVFELMYLNFL